MRETKTLMRPTAERTCSFYRCGGAVGMYIDLKRWTTVYLYAGSGSFGPMPFLDCHGELDQGMR